MSKPSPALNIRNSICISLDMIGYAQEMTKVVTNDWEKDGLVFMISLSEFSHVSAAVLRS